MEEVEVAAPNEEPVIFPSRCWLAEDEGDGLAVRVLKPGETMQPTYDSKFKLSKRRKIFTPWEIEPGRDFTCGRRGKCCTGRKVRKKRWHRLKASGEMCL